MNDVAISKLSRPHEEVGALNNIAVVDCLFFDTSSSEKTVDHDNIFKSIAFLASILKSFSAKLQLLVRLAFHLRHREKRRQEAREIALSSGEEQAEMPEDEAASPASSDAQQSEPEGWLVG